MKENVGTHGDSGRLQGAVLSSTLTAFVRAARLVHRVWLLPRHTHPHTHTPIVCSRMPPGLPFVTLCSQWLDSTSVGLFTLLSWPGRSSTFHSPINTLYNSGLVLPSSLEPVPNRLLAGLSCLGKSCLSVLQTSRVRNSSQSSVPRGERQLALMWIMTSRMGSSGGLSPAPPTALLLCDSCDTARRSTPEAAAPEP